MTKVQVNYKLTRVVDDRDMEAIARIHGVYGFFAVRVAPSLEELFVEYDASRLTRKDLLATLEAHGLPVIVPVPPIAAPVATAAPPPA